ncbi:30S ribosomal protein S4 [bacterium]|jgi:small subunit ribosomal protein S4|nr:30S ribosomal protein S4 [bacterium]NBW56955.1 30S ribosomal protein S4 [bacterium]NBX71916.1 30S ribosomal protein S4 [bacterium]
MAKNSSSRKPQCRDARKFRDLTISGIKTVSLSTKARNANPPGQHGPNRKKGSDYANMLAEKQKLRLIHGNVKEHQFRRFFELASRMKGQTSLNLLRLLEIRLVNVIYKAGFATTLAEARQLVAHRAIQVARPGKGFVTVDCPSFLVKEGYVVALRPKARAQSRVLNAVASHTEQGVALSWLNINHQEFKAEVSHLPDREQLPQNINENLIIELYSK